MDSILEQSEIIKQHIENKLVDERKQFYERCRDAVLNKDCIDKSIAHAIALGHKSVEILRTTKKDNIKELFEIPQYENNTSILQELQMMYGKPLFKVKGYTRHTTGYVIRDSGKRSDKYYIIKLKWNNKVKWYNHTDDSE